MVSLFLLLGCNLSYIVDLFTALHELVSAGARTLLKLASSVGAPYGDVDWLGKLPLQERQLSRTQHFNLFSKLTSSHVRSFHTHNRLMRNTADPYDMTELSPINRDTLIYRCL